MFCYHCGSQLYNGMSKCPFCQADMQIINETIFDSTLNKIMPFCPKFDVNEGKTFQIGGYTISVPESHRFVIALNNFMNLVFENSWKELAEWMHYLSFDTMVEVGEKKLQSLAEDIALSAVAFMRSSGCEVDSHYAEKSLAFLWDVSYMWEPVYEIAKGFGDAKKIMDIARKNAATPRTNRWVGGGFGLGGAVKGTVIAGALNLGGEALHGAKNLAKSQVANLYNRRIIRQSKNEIKESQEFQMGIKDMWRNHLMTLHMILKTFMATKLDVGDFKSPYDWGEDLQYTFSQCSEENAANLLAKNLYDVNAYINFYLANREYGKALCEMADYCGILDVVGKAFVQYGDKSIIAKMDEKSIGYDTPYRDLETLKQEIDTLENCNLIYQRICLDPLIIREQRYAKKVRLCYSLSKVSTMMDYYTNLRDRKKIVDIAEAIISRNDDLEMEIFRSALAVFADDDITILDDLARKGGLVSELANEFRLYIEISKSNAEESETHRKLKQLADQEHPFAMALLGDYYLNCEGEMLSSGKTKEAGVNYIKKAARHKVCAAMAYVGDWYRLGKFGFPYNKELAEQYLLLAAEMHDTDAKKSLSELQGGKK